jgi:hypothetical protein
MVSKATWQAIMEATPVVMGKQTSLGFELDPKHLGFVLARYKFVAKLAEPLRLKKAVEIGCGDGFPTAENRAHNSTLDAKVTFSMHDILSGPVPGGPFDLAYSLDVVEHIPADMEHKYYKNIVGGLAKRSMAVIGTPNKTAEAWQSENSRVGHINLKTFDALRNDMSKYFEYVLMFGINDEVVHTGYAAMCHYLIAVGLHPLNLD